MGHFVIYSGITGYILTYGFSGSTPVKSLAYISEGLLVLVNMKMVWKGDISFLDVSYFETRNLFCGMQKKANNF